jgi:hypothetical protein
MVNIAITISDSTKFLLHIATCLLAIINFYFFFEKIKTCQKIGPN